MKFLFPLEKVKIIKRYKRFLADVERSDGSILTVHVANTGPMLGAWETNGYCYIMAKKNQGKLSHGAELVLSKNSLVGINTQIPNKLIKKALEDKFIPQLKEYGTINPEFTLGDSKLDFKLTQNGLKDCFVEVKNCSGKKDNLGFFPDTVSERAVKHLKELIQLKEKGFRSVLIFVVQREDVDGFTSGDLYHPEYGLLLREAISKGVEVICYSCDVNLESINLKKQIKLVL